MSDPGFSLTHGSLKRVINTTRQSEDSAHVPGTAWQAWPPSIGGHPQTVKVTGALAGNYYPGKVYFLAGDDTSMEEGLACWVWALNDQELAVNYFYGGRLTGEYGGAPVYYVEDFLVKVEQMPGGTPETFHVFNFRVDNDQQLTWTDSGGGVGILGWEGVKWHKNGAFIATRRCGDFIEGANIVITTTTDSQCVHYTIATSLTPTFTTVTTTTLYTTYLYIGGTLFQWLTVRESDGAPSTSPCFTIKINQDHRLTWTDNGGNTGELGFSGIGARAENAGAYVVRRNLDFQAGPGLLVTVTDDAANAEVDVKYYLNLDHDQQTIGGAGLFFNNVWVDLSPGVILPSAGYYEVWATLHGSGAVTQWPPAKIMMRLADGFGNPIPQSLTEVVQARVITAPEQENWTRAGHIVTRVRVTQQTYVRVQALRTAHNYWYWSVVGDHAENWIGFHRISFG